MENRQNKLHKQYVTRFLLIRESVTDSGSSCEDLLRRAELGDDCKLAVIIFRFTKAVGPISNVNTLARPLILKFSCHKNRQRNISDKIILSSF